MKVLLRNERTGLYVGEHIPWVANPEYAVKFSTLELAAWQARKFGRDDVVVVLRYEQPQCELALNPAYCVTEAHGEHRMAKNVSAAMENNQWSENA